QLDGWHQYEHPYYWMQDMIIEAEHADKAVKASIETEASGKHQLDFSGFRTFVRMKPGSELSFLLPAKRGPYTLGIRMNLGSRQCKMKIYTKHGTLIKKI